MKQLLLVALFVSSLFVACSSGRDVIADEQTKSRVAARLASRSAWLPTLNDALSDGEREALEFLYAYMPVGDVADYSTEFYLQNVQATLTADRQMPWGKLVPEQEFLHFVLPIRVNNEALDTSRIVFFAELKDRLKGLTMKEAILEVNHWCHQKVNYTPSDARTMSPLALMANATGRCGEESTFTVAALRAVGIPARQIYVPRWAHTDDNHAWVEAWAADDTQIADQPIRGKWYYMGACEPEAELNTGWFDAPAKRSLLMLTKVFGHYVGGEQVLSTADGYTEVSVTENYAPVRRVTVEVKDENSNPVKGAEVFYTIYNYANYYPASRKTTDEQGQSSLTAGLGDMVVFASKDGMVASAIADFRTIDTLHLVLGQMPTTFIDLDITPPAEQLVQSTVSDQARRVNDIRFAAEDSLRLTYVSTFIDRKASNEIAIEIGADTTRTWNILSTTRGNHAQISTFLLNAPRENLEAAFDLLEVISLKDLRDTPCDVLLDHLVASLDFIKRPFYKQYILNPRVDNELLTPYRSALCLKDTTIRAKTVIESLANTVIVDSLNPARLAISPLGVSKLRMGDRTSAERLVIASLRSNGIASRREPITKRLQYYEDQEWHYITSTTQTIPDKGLLMVREASGSAHTNPKLDTHFTISRWNGSFYVPLQFESLGVDMGGDANLSRLFDKPLTVEQGHYMLTTGTRLASGRVLARNVPIEVKKDSLTNVELVMRLAEDQLSVIGSIDQETKYFPQNSAEAVSLITTTGRGYCVVALIDAKKEPTTHFMRALSRQKATLEKWGRPIVLILRSKEQLELLDLKDFPDLPSNVSLGYDDGSKVSTMIGAMCEVKDMNRLPVVVVGDGFGRVVYVSTGYNTSIAEHMATIIELL